MSFQYIISVNRSYIYIKTQINTNDLNYLNEYKSNI